MPAPAAPSTNLAHAAEPQVPQQVVMVLRAWGPTGRMWVACRAGWARQLFACGACAARWWWYWCGGRGGHRGRPWAIMRPCGAGPSNHQHAPSTICHPPAFLRPALAHAAAVRRCAGGIQPTGTVPIWAPSPNVHSNMIYEFGQCYNDLACCMYSMTVAERCPALLGMTFCAHALCRSTAAAIFAGCGSFT
jgi:hypothetical protein